MPGAWRLCPPLPWTRGSRGDVNEVVVLPLAGIKLGLALGPPPRLVSPRRPPPPGFK